MLKILAEGVINAMQTKKTGKRILTLILAAAFTFTGITGTADFTAVDASAADTSDSSVSTVSTASDFTPVRLIKVPDDTVFTEVTGGTSSSTSRKRASDTRTSSYWYQFDNDYFYDQLSSSEKNLYDALDTQCMDFLTGSSNAASNNSTRYGTTYVISEDGADASGLTTDEMSVVMEIFLYSNPQYYFLDGSAIYKYSFYDEYSMSLGVYSSFIYGSSRSSYTSQLASTIDTYLSNASSASTVLGQEKSIHDQIVNNVTYQENQYDQSIYSVFAYPYYSVCAGYAKSFSLLMNGLGVNTIAVTSDSHAWNEIEINGTWYVVDVTWDDSESDSNYDYFDISSSTLDSLDQDYAHVQDDTYDLLNVPYCYTDLDLSIIGTSRDNSGSTSTNTSSDSSSSDNSDQNTSDYNFSDDSSDLDISDDSFSDDDSSDEDYLYSDPDIALMNVADWIDTPDGLRLRSAKKRRITVRAYETDNDGYVICYWRKGYSGIKKYVYVTSSGDLKYVLRNLKSKKTYYVRLCSYYIDNDGTQYRSVYTSSAKIKVK